EVDVASETAIRSFLHEETPDTPMLGEESGGVSEGLRWVVDPLDGTTNFLHRFPAVGVSVALVEDQVPLAGAIDAPFLGDTWHVTDWDGSPDYLTGNIPAGSPAVHAALLDIARRQIPVD